MVNDKKIARIEDKEANSEVTFSNIFHIITDRKILIISIAGGFMVGTLEGFADVWVFPFFTQIYHFTPLQSSSAGSLIFFGMCVGGPILAFLADYYKSCIKVIIISAISTMLIFTALFYYTSWSLYLVYMFMFTLGILCCYQVLVFTITTSLVDKSLTSVAIALVNCINMSFGYLFHLLIGNIMQSHWQGKFSDLGSRLYNFDSYLIALSTIPLGCFIGVLGFIYLYLKYPKVKL